MSSLALGSWKLVGCSGYWASGPETADRTASSMTSTASSLLKALSRSSERQVWKSRLTNLRSALTDGYSVRLGGNGNDEGGGCFGDSGGPVFYGGFSSNTIVALSGWWLGPRRVCTGSGYYYRTDRQEVVDWILETVPESEASEIDLVEP